MTDAAVKQTVVVGVGAVGCRLAAAIRGKPAGHRYLFVDTDSHSLGAHPEEETLLIGAAVCGGRGTGKRPELARRAAVEAEDEIKQALGPASVVVVAAAFGGGTGVGAGPMIARFARELGAEAIVGAVDPFVFESSVRAEYACEALLRAGDQAEAVVRIPCTLLPDNGGDGPGVRFREAFAAAEEHAAEAAVALVQIVSNPGMLRVDFGDLRRVLCEPGGAVIGVGRADGAERVENAIRHACNSSFLDSHRLHAAANIALHVAGGDTLSLKEVEEGARAIRAISGADYLLSVDVRPELSDEVIATVLLSGVSADSEEARPPAELEGPPPPGAFVYEGVNIDVPTFLRRSRGPHARLGGRSSAHRFAR